jgi:hypothetical protein
VANEDDFDRWYVLKSADAMAGRSFTTAEIVSLHEQGALSDRTVVYHKHASRRDGMTVKELVDRARAGARKK